MTPVRVRLLDHTNRLRETFHKIPFVTRRLVMFGVPFIILSSLFIDIAKEVRDSETLQNDNKLLLAIREQANPGLDHLMSVVTNLGGAVAIAVLTTSLTALLWRYVSKRHGLTILASVLGAVTLNLLLKELFGRDRPTLWETLVTEHGFSFPSGHAMASSALGFSIMVTLWNTRFRVPACIVAGFYIVLVGFSRLYLGVHYPTDVLAGWVLSGTWVILMLYVFYPQRARVKAPATPK